MLSNYAENNNFLTPYNLEKKIVDKTHLLLFDNKLHRPWGLISIWGYHISHLAKPNLVNIDKNQ